MKSVYNPQLVSAAEELITNEPFKLLITDYMDNLQVSVMDASDPGDIISAHKEHASIVAFAEYIQMLGAEPLKRKGQPEYV